MWKNLYPILFLLNLCSFTSGCKKYLDAKPDNTLLAVTSIEQLDGVLENPGCYTMMPVAPQLATDDGYFTTQNFNSVYFEVNRRTYLWNPTVDLSEDWLYAYKKVFTMNVVLAELTKLRTKANVTDADRLEGTALFYRAMSYYDIAQIFSPYYKTGDPDSDYGIPLRSNPEIEQSTDRAGLRDTYHKIISDLENSLRLIPRVPLFLTRPGHAAVYGALARIYLQLADYEKAGVYADSCLAIHDALLNYNDADQVDLAGTNSFRMLNPEVILHATSGGAYFMNELYVDTTLFSSYEINDLRSEAFFYSVGADHVYKGSYSGEGSSILFTGISTSEILLIRAEAFARSGNTSDCLKDVNSLLLNRWKTGTFIAKTASSPEEALSIVITERRKELCFRSILRWSDLRRLNRESAFAKTLVRMIDGNSEQLTPDDPRYAFLIPVSVVSQNTIKQNPR